MVDFKIPSKTPKYKPVGRASTGLKKDLLILQFALAVLQVNKLENEDEVVKRNGQYQLNKKIDRRLDKFIARLQATMNNAYSLYGTELAQWFKDNLDKRIGKTLAQVKESVIQLELMALWVMYVNFAESSRHFDSMFNEYKDEQQYFALMDLLNETNVNELEHSMFMLSYRIIASIKN